MLETDISRICKTLDIPHVYTLRSLMLHFYQCQMTTTDDSVKVFDAFFKIGRDAKWCRRQVICRRCKSTVNYILWPPLALKPITTLRVINIRNIVFVPVSPPFMDQHTLRQFLGLYGVA
jgi:hypothetical protein